MERTPYCIHCAKQQQGESVEESGPAAPESASLPADYQGLSDDGLKTAVYEQLKFDSYKTGTPVSPPDKFVPEK